MYLVAVSMCMCTWGIYMYVVVVVCTMVTCVGQWSSWQEVRVHMHTLIIVRQIDFIDVETIFH